MAGLLKSVVKGCDTVSDLAKMELMEIAVLPGVKDITPVIAKARFAQALRAEAKGDHETGEKLLGEAIEKLSN